MKILDKLKSFFGGSDSKALIDIRPDVDINSTRTNTSGTGQTGKIKNRGTVQIDNSTNYNITINLPPDGKVPEQVTEYLREQFNKGNLQFLFQSSNNEIEDYNEFEKNPKQSSTIDFFKDKISSEDLQCLKTGLYVKKLMRADVGRAIQIRDRATIRGKRARNVVSIASAGYFETFLRPIFENKPIEEARQEYEEIVESLPEYIFVYGGMTEQRIVSEIDSRITQKERYHLQLERLVVIGLDSCVDKIMTIYQKTTDKYPEYDISLEIKEDDELKQAKLTIDFPVISSF